MDGKAFIFSAPSGSGKTTIVKNLLQDLPGLAFSISATTREPRSNEKNGTDYHFLSVEQFKKSISNNEFIEWEEVYPDIFYGTLKSEVERIWQKGKSVIFDVDVKGGISLKKYFGEKALSFFIKVPSTAELAKRLKSRGTDSTESIAKRIEKAEYEMGFQNHFDVVVTNDILHTAISTCKRSIGNFK